MMIMTNTYFDKSKWKHGVDTSMAQDAYKTRTPVLILGFRGFKSSSNFGDPCCCFFFFVVVVFFFCWFFFI